MRAKRKRLQLNRETLRALQSRALSRVVGGAISLDPEFCERDLTVPDSICNICGGGPAASAGDCGTTVESHTCDTRGL